MSADCGLGVDVYCRLPICENVVDRDSPADGVWAGVCKACRRQETVAAMVYEMDGFTVPGLRNPDTYRKRKDRMTTDSPLLSARELEILSRAAEGNTNDEIARALFISPETVKSHVRHILTKTGCSSRTQAVALALRQHLIS